MQYCYHGLLYYELNYLWEYGNDHADICGREPLFGMFRGDNSDRNLALVWKQFPGVSRGGCFLLLLKKPPGIYLSIVGDWAVRTEDRYGSWHSVI